MSETRTPISERDVLWASLALTVGDSVVVGDSTGMGYDIIRVGRLA